MNTTFDPKERFRRGFVLVLTIAYMIVFIAIIDGFIEALLLAAVFSGIVYPIFSRLQWLLKGRNTLASLMTLVISLVAIIVPLLFLLGLIAEQAIEVANTVKPMIEQRLDNPESGDGELPSWIPFADHLETHRDKITAKLAELASKTGVYLAGSLARLSQGTFVFFLNLFVMLYAMFYFLINGPVLIRQIMDYAPLTHDDKEKMLKVGLSVSRATVKGTLVIGIIQGTLGGVAFAVAGIDAAVFWGAVMAVLSILPGIGATLVWLPAVVYLLMAGNMVAGVGLLIWSAGVVGTVDNFLRPYLVGRDTQMPDLLILLSTLGGLGLFGASGLVLGPIIAALFMTVLSIYSRVFADWLDPDRQIEAPPADEQAG